MFKHLNFEFPIMKNNNKIHIEPHLGIFVGELNDNKLHKHYALQVSISCKNDFVITDENNLKQSYTSCLIQSNITHRFESQYTTLIILINPISSLGHQLFSKFRNTPITSLDKDFDQLSSLFSSYLKGHIDFSNMTTSISSFFHSMKCACEKENHVEDERIYEAIQYLESNADRIVSLKEIAAICFLSETRFLHLFKEKTNLNFRRYQLWNKLLKSIPLLKTKSVTETAMQYGFTDSSHYTRTFKETFGLTPKFILSI